MRSRFNLATLLACSALAPALPLRAADFVTLLEAENREVNRASVSLSSAADASGGYYANTTADYHPLFNGDWPAEEAELLTVWVRARGHALQLKAVSTDGKQSEFSWNWDRPAAWRWISLGTYERSRLGAGFIIIRAGGAAPADAGLDAVIVTNDPNFRPRDTSAALP